MALKSMVMEFGIGTDIRGGDYTKAAVRAVETMLRQNSITFAQAFDRPKDKMLVKIAIGVAKPDLVDRSAIAALVPNGEAQVTVEEGGMDIPNEDGSDVTVLANAVATVYVDIPDDRRYGDG